MSLARSLQRSSLLVRMRRAQAAGICAATLAIGLLFAFGPLSALTMVAVALAVACCWPVDRAALARALDDANGMQGRVVAAYEFTHASARTPFMEAALRDVEGRALSVRAAVPALPFWMRWLALVPAAALLLWFTRPGPTTTPRAEHERPAPLRSAPSSGSDARAQALAELAALEAQLGAREASRQRVLEALGPVVKDARVAPGSAQLRSLAEALRAGKVSAAQRASLQEALERAREREQARLAAAQQDAARREQERKLERLTRPEGQRAQHDERAREQSTSARGDERSQREQSPGRTGEHGGQDPRAGAAAPGHSDQRAPESEAPDLERRLARAAEALARGEDREAAEALQAGADALDERQREAQRQRDELAQQREQLQRPPGDARALAQFEREARGGGSERDTGEHEPAERRLGGSYQDQRLRGVHGEGPSRSQVIEGASQTGFASAPYRRVYADYRAHAEQLLERDDVPSGERFYVRRYFQLVEPR